MHFVKVHGADGRPKGENHLLTVLTRDKESQELSVAWENHHMEIGILKIQSNKSVIVIQWKKSGRESGSIESRISFPSEDEEPPL